MRIAMYPTELHFRKLASHFVSLTSGDRFLRFGAVVTDVDIVAYVKGLFASTANVFAVIEPDGDISGVLHLEFADGGANVGLSVSSWARNQGIGTLLLQRAGVVARARGLQTLFVRNLNFNSPLQRLALRLGMNLLGSPDTPIRRGEMQKADDHDLELDDFRGRITLVADPRPCQFKRESTAAMPLDLAKPISSRTGA